MVNIAKNYRQYSPEDLRDMAYRGILEANGLDLSDFLEYLFQGMYGEQDLKEAFEDGKRQALESQGGVCEDCSEEY